MGSIPTEIPLDRCPFRSSLIKGQMRISMELARVSALEPDFINVYPGLAAYQWMALGKGITSPCLSFPIYGVDVKIVFSSGCYED